MGGHEKGSDLDLLQGTTAEMAWKERGNLNLSQDSSIEILTWTLALVCE
jgi:hypothetical protein